MGAGPRVQKQAGAAPLALTHMSISRKPTKLIAPSTIPGTIDGISSCTQHTSPRSQLPPCFGPSLGASTPSWAFRLPFVESKMRTYNIIAPFCGSEVISTAQGGVPRPDASACLWDEGEHPCVTTEVSWGYCWQRAANQDSAQARHVALADMGHGRQCCNS